MKGKGKGRNPNSKKALEATMWKPGHCPNPKGRPKGSLSLKERMAPFLESDIKVKLPDGTITDKTVLDTIIAALISQAQRGNIKAIQEVFDRNFGKEAENINVYSQEQFINETMGEINERKECDE